MCIYEWEQQRRPTDAGHFSFFFSLFSIACEPIARATRANFRPISISLYPRVRVFASNRFTFEFTSHDNRDNKARLIGSYNRTDRCSLSRFIHLRSRRESFHPCHGEIRAYKLRSKNKDNRKRTELFSLDPRDSNGKSSGIPNTIRSDGVSLISAISA